MYPNCYTILLNDFKISCKHISYISVNLKKDSVSTIRIKREERINRDLEVGNI